MLFLCDGSTCDVTGVGMVKIKMFDVVVCTLSGVLYVLKILRNQISINRLDSMGYKYLVVSGAMKIM